MKGMIEENRYRGRPRLEYMKLIVHDIRKNNYREAKKNGGRKKNRLVKYYLWTYNRKERWLTTEFNNARKNQHNIRAKNVFINAMLAV